MQLISRREIRQAVGKYDFELARREGGISRESPLREVGVSIGQKEIGQPDQVG